ncbi:MAG: TetR family transcriptional regulator, partial [Gammaproteobacteria bacterium HGW-Gammaproteobacteria-14]
MSSTKERILATSLELFNRLGERNVTTNHIAESLGISPGNLYYHYRNKGDIVFSLFERYQATVEAFLQVPPDRPLTWQDKVGYFESILQSMWGTRFLHRDMAHLLNQDERLRNS